MLKFLMTLFHLFQENHLLTFTLDGILTCILPQFPVSLGLLKQEKLDLDL